MSRGFRTYVRSRWHNSLFNEALLVSQCAQEFDPHFGAHGDSFVVTPNPAVFLARMTNFYLNSNGGTEMRDFSKRPFRPSAPSRADDSPCLGSRQ
jgi:hypothetical protein